MGECDVELTTEDLMILANQAPGSGDRPPTTAPFDGCEPEQDAADEAAVEELAAQLEAVGVKYDSGKLRFDLLPPVPLMDVVEVYTWAVKAGKYPARNWEGGMNWGRVFAAAMRHMWKWWNGEERDPETELSHLAHAAWNIFCLLEYTRTHPELDDRPSTKKARESHGNYVWMLGDTVPSQHMEQGGTTPSRDHREVLASNDAHPANGSGGEA